MAGPSIALLTDFGAHGLYVGVLKGVLSTIAPHASIIDVSHDVPPGDVRSGALILWQVTPYFPPNTVFLCVIDPGVGTARQSVAAAWKSRICVGPDNGLFSYLSIRDGAPEVIELASRDFQLDPVSRTFHGRDIYAPAAAHLASGARLTDLGPPTQLETELPVPRLDLVAPDRIEGECLNADRFGNLITSIGVLRSQGDSLQLDPWLGQGPSEELPSGSKMVSLPDGIELPFAGTFSELDPGAGLAYIGSSGLLEIGINQGRAEDEFGLRSGQTVTLVVKG